MEVTLTLSSLDHAEGFGAELLPLLALRLAGRLDGAGDHVNDGALRKVLSFECSDLRRGAGHVSRVGVEALLPVPISYTLVRACQRFSVVICNISIASPTLLAIPAIPPAAATALSHCCCSGRMRPPDAAFTSMLVNTAICWPTISGVIVRTVQPIRSALPLHNPNVTGLPLISRSVPVLLRNNRQLPILHASRMCCWIVCSDGKA